MLPLLILPDSSLFTSIEEVNDKESEGNFPSSVAVSGAGRGDKTGRKEERVLFFDEAFKSLV
jgi:hypothetical protein